MIFYHFLVPVHGWPHVAFVTCLTARLFSFACWVLVRLYLLVSTTRRATPMNMMTRVSGSNTRYVACMGGTTLIVTRITQKWVWNNFSSWLVDVPWWMMICPLFLYNFLTSRHSRLWGRVPKLVTPLEVGWEKHSTFYFTESFRCFRLNKSVLETTETKQADSQLCFAQKIIKIHLLVFENELIEDAIPVSKKFQNRKPVF